MQVLFGGVPAASLVLVDANTLEVTTPAGTAGTYAPIQVIVDGQTAAGSVSYYYQPPDSTPPVIVGTASGPRVGEWFTGDVEISWSITDPESLVTETSGCMTEVWSWDTPGTSFGCMATSAGGSSTQWIVVKHDRSPPVLRVREPQGVYQPGTTIMADYTCTDGLSGAADCVGPTPSGTPFTISGTPGMKTFSVYTTDIVGNSTTQTKPYAIATGHVHRARHAAARQLVERGPLCCRPDHRPAAAARHAADLRGG